MPIKKYEVNIEAVVEKTMLVFAVSPEEAIRKTEALILKDPDTLVFFKWTWTDIETTEFKGGGGRFGD